MRKGLNSRLAKTWKISCSISCGMGPHCNRKNSSRNSAANARPKTSLPSKYLYRHYSSASLFTREPSSAKSLPGQGRVAGLAVRLQSGHQRKRASTREREASVVEHFPKNRRTRPVSGRVLQFFVSIPPQCEYGTR